MPDLAFNAVVTSPSPPLSPGGPSQTVLVSGGRGRFEERWSGCLLRTPSSGLVWLMVFLWLDLEPLVLVGWRDTPEVRRPSNHSPSGGTYCHRDLPPVVLTLTTGWRGVHWAALL